MREVSSATDEMGAGRVEICVTVEDVARTHDPGPRDIRGAAAQTLLMDGEPSAGNRPGDADGRKRGLLTVCRLNVLGPLLNQLTYCLCGRQPLPCLHGTFLLSFPFLRSPPPGDGGVPSVHPSVHPSVRRFVVILLLFHSS